MHNFFGAQRGEFLCPNRETGWKGSTAELPIEIAKARWTF